MQKIKWGIVSAGRISSKFCNDLIQLEDADVYGIAARDIKSAEEFAKKFNVKKAYEGYQAMFDDPEIDVVYIGTPHTFHYENARDAILAGKHVLCEKPLVVSPEQCESLCQLAKEKNVFLMEAMWTYFLPAIRKAKEWIQDGRLGKIQHIKIDFGYGMKYSPTSREYNADLAGGSLFDMGIYPLALTWFFLETDLENINVFNQNAPNGVDEDVIIIADCGDARATLSTSFKCNLANSAQIIGDEGYITIPHASRAVKCELYRGDDCIDQFVDERNSYGYAFEAMEVHDCLRNGETESSLVPHSVSLKLQIQMNKISSLFTR
ncbi:Gfo/Idh/MocA family protein [Paraglaciecola chathamensis]|uniref:Dihydrodiol dehydrogenase n=1 Tax=Paraglaciecola agarilytica NO2 TaxID=1125747 RepID=A0ABQ0IED3_9ALTE|nr:Gfo/Idh/MocA family oxidoreductase [Paraglaciecola agarilytica]GAC07571.1 dihydrodiol dehydrogenase [Paraglaciecola agarilytica NO2]